MTGMGSCYQGLEQEDGCGWYVAKELEGRPGAESSMKAGQGSRSEEDGVQDLGGSLKMRDFPGKPGNISLIRES